MLLTGAFPEGEPGLRPALAAAPVLPPATWGKVTVTPAPHNRGCVEGAGVAGQGRPA